MSLYFNTVTPLLKSILEDLMRAEEWIKNKSWGLIKLDMIDLIETLKNNNIKPDNYSQ